MVFFTVLMLMCGATFTQENKRRASPGVLHEFLVAGAKVVSAEQAAQMERAYATTLEQLRKKKNNTRSDLSFLKHVFYVVHQRHLKQYEQYVTFSEIWEHGQKYDCVTGTTLYALLLGDLGVDYEIHETDYHVYLIAKRESGVYMFESTDPLNGFVYDAQVIAQRRAFIHQKSSTLRAEEALGERMSREPGDAKGSYIDRVVDLKQLLGLHYYNQSLKHLNEGSYKKAYEMIVSAEAVYPSARIKHLGSLIFSMAFGD